MKIRTLIVDDERLARERLRQLLADEPAVEIAGECSNGAQAVEAIRSLRPALVFLDVQMPELDGFEVLNSIDAKAMPVIVFVTAHDEFAVKAFEIHAADYLLKPFNRERFQIWPCAAPWNAPPAATAWSAPKTPGKPSDGTGLRQISGPPHGEIRRTYRMGPGRRDILD